MRTKDILDQEQGDTKPVTSVVDEEPEYTRSGTRRQ